MMIADLCVDCKSEITMGGPVAPEREAFDGSAFFAALDAERMARKLNWKTLALEAGVSASTLTRMAQGKRPDVDTFSALVRWAGLDADSYMRPRPGTTAKEAPEPLAMISTYLRSDPNLSVEAAEALDEVVKATYARLRSDR
jgi:transcriptional regulator with XRE-family HTH domain